MAERWLGLGVSCVKVKVGLDPETDVARVRAVREVAGPDIPVTIDANCGWTLAQARQTAPRFVKHGPGLIGLARWQTSLPSGPASRPM